MDVFDLRNAIVPFSLLDIRQRFKQMRPGESLVVLWSDSAAADDLLRVLPQSALKTVTRIEVHGEPAFFRVELIKTQEDPINPRGGATCPK
jgi:TusA-related sulfurtransferase